MKIPKITIVFIYVLWNIAILFLPASKVFAEKDIKSTIDNYVETFIKEHQIPGASIAIVHKDDLFYSKAWGRTGETEEKITTETPFTIGSISKSLTGLAVMKLMEEDAVRLEDPIQKYIPWFTLKDKEASSKITIKHLLTHSSGISTYSGLAISDKESEELSAIKDNVKSLSNVILTAFPGEKHQYSNANYLILGALIEEVTNQTYSDYMEQEIFLPLGMKDAAADKDTAYKKGYLSGHQSWFGIPRKSSITYDNGGAPYGYIAASAEDMTQYIKFLSQSENANFITEKTMNLYVSPQVQTNENRFYSLGLRITNPNSEEKMIWHSGSTPDSHAEMFFIPKTEWGGVILTNKNHILEEEALSYLKQGIINIINREDPVDIPPNTPIVQLVTTGIICFLFVMCIYLLVKIKLGKFHRRMLWFICGIAFGISSIGFIPSLTYSTGSPWHAIKVFSPDLAYLSIGIVVMLALNGLISMLIACKKQPVDKVYSR
ncbi:serine hydrolase domain-containing protein [Bacillus cereus]|uniref:serine hydrolase domain-containing protein n=1 Tax=Bacillus cereus TaxID=1396 RepID=UPI00356D62C8